MLVIRVEENVTSFLKLVTFSLLLFKVQNCTMKLIVCRLIVLAYMIINYGFLCGGKQMTLLHIFAQNVYAYRAAKGISQEKLAELSGLHRTYISAIEREKRNISIDNIERIATALDIEPYKLLFKEE